MPISSSLINTGILPGLCETPFVVRSSGGAIAYGGGDLVYQADDYVSFALGVLDGFPFGVTDAPTVSGYLLYVNLTDDIRVSTNLETSDYVNDRTLGDHYFSIGSGVNSQSKVVFYDAAGGFIYLSDDGGVTVDAGAACNLDFSAFDLTVSQNQIVESGGVYYANLNDAGGVYYSSDLATWALDSSLQSGYFCQSESATSSLIWTVSLSGGSFLIQVNGASLSLDSGGAVSFKLAPDGENILLYAFTDAVNFSCYRLTYSAPVSQTSGNQGITGGGINGQGGAVGFSGVSASNSSGFSLASLAYPAGIVPRGVNDFGIDLGL